jgi:hypothetical protein
MLLLDNEMRAPIGPLSGETKGYAPTNAATTQATLSTLTGFEKVNAAMLIGIVSDAAVYIAFGDSAVTIDTANDVFIPANEVVFLIATGPFFGMRGVSGTANVRIWPASRP